MTGFWSNGLLRRGLGLAVALAVVPPLVLAGVDHAYHVHCVKPVKDLKKGSIIVAGDLARTSVLRTDLPPQADHDSNSALGRKVATDLSSKQCVTVNDILPPTATFQFSLEALSVIGTPAVGHTVDVLFAPTEGQDSRDGASVDAVPVLMADQHHITVELNKDQQQTVLKFVARSRVIVRAH